VIVAETRIQKALADAGVASRRASDLLVAQGRVRVNGRPAVAGQRVDPDADRIEVDGRPLRAPVERSYLALAKPVGVTSTVRDRHADRTVLDLVPRQLRHERIYPVGRLDRDSEGLLLLTNDGDWAQRVLHPRHAVDREYAVGLRHELTERQAHELLRGIPLDEGLATLVALRPQTATETRRVEAMMGEGPRLTWYRAVLRQGWRRQLRRMFGAVAAPVERLVRVRIGTVRLEGLRPGDVRPLTPKEREQLAPSPAVERRSRIVVSLDGPGSSGKSSVGAAAAQRLGLRFCDTGLLYRALTWLALERAIDREDAVALAALAGEVELAESRDGRLDRVLVDGRDVTDAVHSGAVDASVSQVARHPEVRARLLARQRAIAAEGGIIMAGRDIGTVVLPDADLRLYLDVSVEERARRRAAERGTTLDEAAGRRILDDLRQRDEIDRTRATAPLRVPEGAVVVYSDGNTFEETVDEVVEVIRSMDREAGR
jgi:cytidylate kinase